MLNKGKWLLNIEGALFALDRVLSVCRSAGNFHPEELAAVGGPEGYAPWNGENNALSLLNRLESIGVNAGIPLEYRPQQAEEGVPKPLEGYVADVEEQVHALHDKRRLLTQALREREEVLEQLRHIKSDFPNLSFEELFSCRYLKIRFGRLPSDSLAKLEYYGGKVFVFVPLDRQKDYCWGLYLTTGEYAPEVDYIFSSLFFERLPLPGYVQGTPEAASQALRQEIEGERAALVSAEEALKALAQREGERLCAAYTRLKGYNDCFPLRKYVYLREERFYLSGLLYGREREVHFLLEELKKIPEVVCAWLPYLPQKSAGPPVQRAPAGEAKAK